MAESLERLIDDVTYIRTCAACGDYFTEAASTGALECRRHTGMLTYHRTYSCCGASPDPDNAAYRGPDASDGCRLCDHSQDAGLPADIELPMARARVLFEIGIDHRRHYTRVNETHVRIHRRR